MTTTEDAKGSGSTQYNQIVDVYSHLYPPGGQTNTNYVPAVIEDQQIFSALTDLTIDVRGKRVLDLAAGNGHCSCKYLSWGAESVIGVDIADDLLEVGRNDARSRGIPETRLRYVVGDVTDPRLVVEGFPFDVVTSCWLLNYASDKANMTQMFDFIGRHLKPGGVYVGLTNPPLLTSQQWERSLLDHVMSPVGAWGRHGNGGQVLETMPNGDGYKARIDLSAGSQEGTASFENYHLRLKIFEESCAATAMFTGLEWRDNVMPDELRKKYPAGHWNELALLPHCRVCVARRIE